MVASGTIDPKVYDQKLKVKNELIIVLFSNTICIAVLYKMHGRICWPGTKHNLKIFIAWCD
jgi:hypothetical protein